MVKALQVTISTIASKLGFSLSKTQLQSVGVAAARLYHKRHQMPPPKESLDLGDDEDRRVNLYTKDDEDLIIEALRSMRA